MINQTCSGLLLLQLAYLFCMNVAELFHPALFLATEIKRNESFCLQPYGSDTL